MPWAQFIAQSYCDNAVLILHGSCHYLSRQRAMLCYAMLCGIHVVHIEYQIYGNPWDSPNRSHTHTYIYDGMLTFIEIDHKLKA